MLGAKRDGIDAAPLQRSKGRLVAYKNIGLRQQTMKHFGAGGIVIVQGDRPFVAIGRQEIRRLCANKRRAPGSRLISHAWPLHLDYLRAKIAQHHGAVRAGKGFCEFDDLNPLEESGHESEL